MSDCIKPNVNTAAARCHSRSPAIFMLTNDALSTILQFIVADVPETSFTRSRPASWIREDNNRPLATLLCCSQVCQKWRSLIATSPLLWAGAVDLDVLTLRCRRWVEDFMRLTKQAPLHVYSLYNATYINARSPGSALSLLNEYWPRIREVKIILIGSYGQLFDSIYSDTPEQNAIFLQKPAPLLENFDVNFSFAEFNPSFSVPTPDSFPFFKGEAPLLRNFKCHDLPGFLVPLSCANLQHLSLGFEHTYHNWRRSYRLPVPRSNIFTTLAGASSLESLVIACNFHSATLDTLKTIPDLHLPRLRNLCIIDETFLTAIEILNRIKPAAGCGLHLRVYPDFDATTHTHSASLEAYATSFFNAHHVSHLELCLKAYTFDFVAQCCCAEHNDNPARLHIENPTGMTLEMLASLSACNYSRITHLSVQASFLLNDDPSERLFTAGNIRIEKFFALLSSVVTLTTSIYFLNNFLTRQPNATVLLPNLQHVLLATSAAGHVMASTPGWISHDDPYQFKGPLCHFAAHRRDIGVPLSTVDKSKFWISLADQVVPPPIDDHRLVTQTLQRD